MLYNADENKCNILLVPFWSGIKLISFYWLQAFATLDIEDIMAKQVEQLEKEKKELNERLKSQEKKVCTIYIIKWWFVFLVTLMNFSTVLWLLD